MTHWIILALELVLLAWFVGVGIEAMLMRWARMPSPFVLTEFHHAYVGAALGWLGFRLGGVTGVLVQALGVVITVDDLYQHIEQTYGAHTHYRSPLHELFATTIWRVPGVPWLVRVLDRWWALGAVAAVVVLLAACLGPRPGPLVPLVPRPDTREIAGALFDSVALEETVRAFRDAYPKETSVCLRGELRDTVLGFERVPIARIRAVTVARADSASELFVWYPAWPRSGCTDEGLIGHAHSHPHVPPFGTCTHSALDANLVFTDQRLLFSLIFCSNGRREILYQDGRRWGDYWLAAK